MLQVTVRLNFGIPPQHPSQEPKQALVLAPTCTTRTNLVFFFVYHFLLGGGGAFLPRCPTLKAPQALPILQNLLQALGCAPRAREHKAPGALQRLR